MAMDRRLQERYFHLVREHSHALNGLTSGPSCLPREGQAFACTQALWRFLANPATTLAALMEPVQELAQQSLVDSAAPVALVIHDWSMLAYPKHSSKRDRLRRTHKADKGYDLSTALLVEAAEGMPVAAMELSLRTDERVYSTRAGAKRFARSHVKQVGEVMRASRSWGLARPLVHVVDREGDSVLDYRQWNREGHWFLVRANGTRRVRWQGKSRLLSKVVETLARSAEWTLPEKPVVFKGKVGHLQLAETTVVLDRPAKTWRGGKQVMVPGEPLELRLVVSRVVDDKGKVLAEWLLLSNVPTTFAAALLAQWYCWRWDIESYFKLLKLAGMNCEAWQQETGEAIAKRLVLASMAAAFIWLLLRTDTPQAQALRLLLVRLSGRQMKWGVESTAPALLTGLQILLALLDTLEHHTPAELRRILNVGIPLFFDTS